MKCKEGFFVDKRPESVVNGIRVPAGKFNCLPCIKNCKICDHNNPLTCILCNTGFSFGYDNFK